MANSHGLTSRIVKRQAKARKLAKNNKKENKRVHIGNENPQVRNNTSYKKRNRYYENKKSFPSKKLPTKSIEKLIEMGIIDERWFFKKGKKKNFITKTMVDKNGLDFYGMPRAK